MEGESPEERFLVLQKRLKEERLFVNNERNQLQELNKEVETVSQDLFYLEWKTRQQWINVDKVVKGGRVNPSECSLALRHTESVNFEDASIHLNYLDLQYGEFISSLKRNTDLVALIINFYDINKVQKATIPITRNLLSSLYGNCIHKEDKLFVLKILNKLMELQIFNCEDLLNLFLGKRSNNAFATVFTLFYENLFSSKLYLTAALHGTVMQVILGDSIYLDVEVSKILSRLPPKTVQTKFGNPGTPEAQIKIKKHMENLHNNIIKLCKNFLKNLQDRVYCFPQSLRYSIYQLYQGMINKMNMPSINAKALISHILMSYFVCPAIINPEPYGINSDADISETARHNLGQVASVLRSLALLGCGLKDEKFKSILDEFEKGLMLDFATKVLEGAEEISLDSFVDDDSLISKNVVLLTEQNLKTLIASIKVLHSYNNSHNLQRNGLTALLNLLPKLPKHWNLGTQSSDSSETLVSIGVPNKERHEKAMRQLFVDLEAAVEPDVPVLVIPLSSTAESQVGMLSEGKVMGEESVESLTDKERRMRTSTLMHNALRQSLSMDDDSLDSLSNSSSKSPKNPDQIDNVFVEEKVKVVDNLINISDDIEAPKLPEKKHRPSLLSEKESLTDNSLPTPDDKRFSTCSMVGGPDGINSILQTATTQLSPATPAIPEGFDPWGAPISQTTSNGFENSFENSFIPPKTPPTAPKSTARPNSLLPEDSIEPNYEKYSEKIIKEVSQQKTEQVGTPEEENMEQKFFRKKSHGTRLKDRISNKITTGMKQVKGNTLARLRDIPQQNKSGSVFTEVPANKVGTPFEASQKSRSLSLKKNERRENAGEAILEKYRSLALQSTPVEEINPFGTPPSSQMGYHNVYKEDKVAVFDKQFKFDDAKKKLRTFLSKTTSILLPSKSTSFDQLLLTMLQGKLAEAINMQDRSAVAQLHETLRSIKQLGVGSLEPLISQLEKDYKERSKYISYLIKCKQALLTTIADIEQLSLKLQRDKGICSKYFTTLSVRLFLETPERKSRCQLFRQKFVSTGMLDEKCDLLHDLLEELNIDLLKEPGWTDCSEEQQIDAEKAIERVLMSRIYRDAFHPNGETDTQNDKIFHDHIITLKEIVTLSHPLLQIPTTFQKEAPWPSAQTELLMVNVYKTAADKLACIHRCCTTIMNLLSMASDKQTPGADDFVPVLVYVVIQANPKNLISTKQYVNTFYETRLSGEEYYCWMQFCAAVEFIKTMRP